MKVIALAGVAGNLAVSLGARLGECTAVAITAEAPVPGLQEAQALGASQLIRLWDPALTEPVQDPLGREHLQATLLAVLCRRLEIRFVVVPETSEGWLGPALAEELDVPHVTGVLDAEIVAPAVPPSGQIPSAVSRALAMGLPTVRVQRRCLSGIQRLRGPAIGVLSVLPVAAGSTVSAQSGASSTAAGRQEKLPLIETWDLARLGISAMDLPRPLIRSVLPEKRTELTGRVFPNLQALAERLRQDGLAPLPKEEGA